MLHAFKNHHFILPSQQEYLSSLSIVHRDLACRNVLIGEGKALKITDFGMSRETEEVYVQSTKGRVPLKWMAIESIVNREFTSASDVWAYGVVLWEIGTLGAYSYHPYFFSFISPPSLLSHPSSLLNFTSSTPLFSTSYLHVKGSEPGGLAQKTPKQIMHSMYISGILPPKVHVLYCV